MPHSTASQRPALLPANALRALLAAALVLLAGCSPYRIGGDIAMHFATQVALPNALTHDDFRIGCRAAEGLGAPTISLEGVGTDVDRVAILLLLGGGVCHEFRAAEHELAFLRAMRAQDPVAAQDARIAQKRLHAQAAHREYAAWRRFVSHYELQLERAQVQCPRLRDQADELVFLVGLLSGVQAVMNDAQSGQAINVPRDIAAQVMHLSTCVDSARWWDLPLALRATVWHVVPMLAPDNVDPLQQIIDIARRGEQDGMRLGYVVWALATTNGGDLAASKTAMREFAAVTARYTPNHEYRMLDAIAGDIVLLLSDRIWTEQTGHRTPMGALGTFPDDPPPPGADISDLL